MKEQLTVVTKEQAPVLGPGPSLRAIQRFTIPSVLSGHFDMQWPLSYYSGNIVPCLAHEQSSLADMAPWFASQPMTSLWR
jgi:hypothetical protein